MDCIFTLKDLASDVLEGRWGGSITTDAGEDVSLDAELGLAEEYCKGIQHQEKVVVLVSNTIQAVAALLSVWHRGGVVVPVKRDVPEHARQDIVDDCHANYVLDPEARLLSPAVGGGAAAPFRYRTGPRLTGVDLALIIYTSGSTGRPKGIMLTHASVISALRSILGYLGIRQSDAILLISPLSFDYGLYQLLFCLASQCRLVMCHKMINPISVVNLVQQRAITVLPLIPALATGIQKYLEKFRKEVYGVRLITNTGGVLPSQTALALKRLFIGADVIKMYGLTESKRVSYLPAHELEASTESVGIPMPGLDAKIFEEIVDDDGRIVLHELPRGEVGQLFVRGTSVFQGYFNLENNGGAKLHSGAYRDDNWLATGDLFMQDEKGFLYFKGRAKDLIKQRGFCLYPRDLETIVYRSPLVQMCVVVGVTDSSGNEIAKLFALLVDSGRQTRDDFHAWLKREMDPDYMFGEIQYLEEMPLSNNGKPDVAQLRKLGASQAQTAAVVEGR
jgi:long-chain acyl-CoA synthetase